MQTALVVRPSRFFDRTEAARAAEGLAPLVFIVDHEPCIRESLDAPGRSFGWQIRKFDSAQAFLQSSPILSPSCLVLNVAMPGLDVFELQERVAIDRPGMPIILVTGTAATPTTVQASSAGTVKLFARPVRDELLVHAIANAIERSQPAFSLWAHTRDLRCRYDGLSRREREVMVLVVSGRLNKQVGGELGISEITVKAHRGSIMRKMRAASLPSLVTMAARLGLRGPDDTCYR